MRFTDGESSNCITREIHFHERVRVFVPQLRVGSALNYAKEHLPCGIAVLREIFARASRPIECTRGSVPRALLCRRRFDAFIENHNDICAKRDLDLKRLLGRKEMRRSVQVRAKRYAFVRYFA